VKNRVVIFGAGLTGLATAHFLQKKGINPVLLEKESEPGGLCRTQKFRGFFFDYTGHLLHFKNIKWKNFIEKHLKVPLVKHTRYAYIFLFERFIPYPFQYHLAHIPREVKEKAILDFLKAKATSSKIFSLWAQSSFGKTMYAIFFKPYNEKLWKIKLNKLTTLWMGRFVPKPDRKKVLEGARDKNFSQNAGYNVEFYYPQKGGISQIIKPIVSGKNIILNSEVKKIDLKKKIVYTKKSKIFYDFAVSTIPLPVFLKISQNEKLKQFSKKLKWVSVKNTNLIVRKDFSNYGHWIYFPDKRINFYRLGFLSNFANVKKGFSSIYIEESYRKKKPKDSVIRQAQRFLNIKKEKIFLKKVLDLPFAYVIYDFEREKILKEIFPYLLKNSVIPAGRFGEWKYSTMEDCFEDGLKTAKFILKKIKK